MRKNYDNHPLKNQRKFDPNKIEIKSYDEYSRRIYLDNENYRQKILLSQIPFNNGIHKLKKRVSSVAILLGLSILFQTKLSRLLSIPENSIYYYIAFFTSLVLGLFYLFIDFRQKRLELKFNTFLSLLDLKEDCHNVFLELNYITPEFHFETKRLQNLHNELPSEFELEDLEKYIHEWKRINGILTYKIKDELPEITFALLTLPYPTIKAIARLIGTWRFARLILVHGLKHELIICTREEVKGDTTLRRIYRMNPKYFKNSGSS